MSLFRFATVTQASPLLVQFDGTGTPVAAAFKSAAYVPAVNDRVRVEVDGRTLVVHFKVA